MVGAVGIAATQGEKITQSSKGGTLRRRHAVLLFAGMFAGSFCINAKERVDFVNQKISAGRIGVLVTDAFGKLLPASSVPMVYKALHSQGFVPVYLNDVANATNWESAPVGLAACSSYAGTAALLMENSMLQGQNFRVLREVYKLDYVLLLSKYHRRALSYNINASIVSLENRSVVAYHFDRRGSGPNAVMGFGCIAWFAAPIFWVSFPVSCSITKARLGWELEEFLKSAKR
jgi:hypothetical protein